MPTTLCCFCETPLYKKNNNSFDHLISVHKGGNNTSMNKKPCCRTCNEEKDNLYLQDYYRLLQEMLVSKSKKNADKATIQKKMINVIACIIYTQRMGRKLFKTDEKWTKYNERLGKLNEGIELLK